MDQDETQTILTVSRSLRADNPLRQQTAAALSDPQVPIEDIQPILRALTSASVFRRKERRVAAWLIGTANWSENQRDALSESLSQSLKKALKAKKPIRVLLRYLSFGMLLSLAFLIVCEVGTGGAISGELCADGIFGHYLGMLALAAFLTVGVSICVFPLPLLIVFWNEYRRSKPLRPAIEALGRLGRPASIAPIATAFTHDPLRAVAAIALKRVTAGLRPEHYGSLPFDTVPALCRALNKANTRTIVEVRRAIVILQALTVVGDGRAIRPVENLVNSVLCPEIEAAAAELLPILQQRAIESQTASELLRASSAPPDGKRLLLRAAYELPIANKSQLLRIVTQEESAEPFP